MMSLNVAQVVQTGFFLLFGSFLGSFCNVVILRMASGVSVVFPPSSCPVCGHRLSAIDLIPVIGWMLLGGHCRYCGVRISWQYPVVEAAVAFLVGAAFYQHGFSLLLVPTAALGIIWLIVSVLILRGEVPSSRPAMYAWAYLAIFSWFLQDPLLPSRTLAGIGMGLGLPLLLRLEVPRWFPLVGFSCAGVWPVVGPAVGIPLLLVLLADRYGVRNSIGMGIQARQAFFLTQLAFLVLLVRYGFWPV